MAKEITPSRRRALEALLKHGPMISLRPYPGARRGFQSRILWFLLYNGYIESKMIPMVFEGTEHRIPHYYLTDKGRAVLGLRAKKSLRETYNDFVFLVATQDELRAAILETVIQFPELLPETGDLHNAHRLCVAARVLLSKLENR